MGHCESRRETQIDPQFIVTAPEGSAINKWQVGSAKVVTRLYFKRDRY